MLKLKKLQLLGFKSFCDRTEIHFPGTGIVAVVGPNGCGKSNIADAISWVLGEQSAKSLRGGRMEDVIFAGTRDRPATGLAEVSLTLIDPQEYELDPPDAAAAGDEPAPAAAGWGEDWDQEAAAPAADAPPAGDDEPAADAAAGVAATQSGAVVLTIRRRRKFIAHNRRGEIVVTRRLYRSGDSEYLMNGRPCRLRDIQDLFMGTGLGPESYAIIEQGRIGQILSSKPYDRRAIIEEAAGVSKYKARRRLAEARLEASRLNLARINDIFEEVTRQVGSLKRQASKAQRYRTLKTELDRQQRRLILGKAALRDAAYAETRQRLDAVRAALQTAAALVAHLEAARAEAAAECAAREQQLLRLTEEAGRIALELDHGGQQIEFHRQQGEELRRRAADNERECVRLEEQSGRLLAEIEQARLEQDASGGLVAAARAQADTGRAAFDAAQQALREIENQTEAARRQGLQLLARISALGNQIAQGEAMIASLERQLARVAGNEAAAQSELEAAGARRGQLQLEFQDQEAESRSLSARLTELEQRAAQLAAEEAAERAQAQTARAALAEVAARRRSLEEIVAHHGYSSEAVKSLFAGQPAEANFQPLGVLGEFIEVDAPYDQLLEQFLHDELNYVVVRGWDQAGSGIQLLQAQAQGRATFLVHAEPILTAFAATPPGPNPGLAAEPGVVSLLREVRALNGFGAGLGQLLPKLRDAYVLAAGADAAALAERYPHAWLLTRDGACYHNYTVTGGAGVNTGPLSLKRELREAVRGEAEATAALAHREQHLELLARQLADARREGEQLRAQRHEMEKRLLTSGQAVRQVDTELTRVQSQLRQFQLEAERGRAEHRQCADRLQQARDQAAQVEREKAGVEEREAAAAEAAAAARAAVEAAAQTLSEQRAALARVEERARAAAATSDRLQRLDRDLSARLGQMRTEGANLEQRQRDLVAASEALALTLTGLRAAGARAAEDKSAQEAGLAGARARVQSVEAELTAGRGELETVRAAQGELEIAVARLQADIEHLRETCRNELGCDLEQLRAVPEPEPAAAAPIDGEPEPLPPGPVNDGDLAALEESVRALRTRIENLGPVNMMALEEFEEAQQRFTFMDAQRQDLLDSIADTQKAIQEIDVVSRQKFQEAFEQINEYFQESFRVLFGGGQGFLRLSEIEGASESGVDIVAQPPGKKLQNALLLSGGEKAMTAMALLLAIFRYQPSPFCLLDEVDAPMDEANVVRFSDMVKQMGMTTQFILITHNKRTMEAAPTLYGVTMPQPGVSRLVSVMVEDQRRAAAS